MSHQSTVVRRSSAQVKPSWRRRLFSSDSVFGGDQLTVIRARSAIKMKVNSHTPSKKLCGIIPVVEDWHAKANS